MVCYLKHNIKRFRSFLIAIFLFEFLILLTGCDPYSEEYPYLCGSGWICEEPSFQLKYTTGDDGRLQSEEVLVWNNTQIYVEVAFSQSTFCVFPKGIPSYEHRLFSGTWEYQNKDLIFFIEEDFLFGDQYKTLAFSKLSQ